MATSGVSSWYLMSQQPHCAPALFASSSQQHEDWFVTPITRQSYRATTGAVVATRRARQSTQTVSRFILAIIWLLPKEGKSLAFTPPRTFFGERTRRGADPSGLHPVWPVRRQPKWHRLRACPYNSSPGSLAAGPYFMAQPVDRSPSTPTVSSMSPRLGRTPGDCRRLQTQQVVHKATGYQSVATYVVRHQPFS